ncbi:MAG: FtsX-like permease family protein [Ammonifex sp.]|jgi:putative ABC transport system permease protein|nr:MAG: FtsX-like permease family protein [Ammonifex sp.]
MNVLTVKLWRTIRHTKGQFLAVAVVVMVAVCVDIALSTGYYNLDRSQKSFYKENNFADYYFNVVRAPEQVSDKIESIPGVTKATGRIQKDVRFLKENGQRVTVRLIGCPLPAEKEVNRPYLLQGRFFEEYPRSGGVEVLVDPKFAEANGLSFNRSVNVIAGGKIVPLTVVGAAVSPESVFIIKEGTLMNDPKTFGIIMLPRKQAEQIFNMSGQINQVVVTLAPGADEKKVAEKVKAILEPYGNLNSYPRKNQLSHMVVEAELRKLGFLSHFVPGIFLGVAAMIQFVTSRRIIKAQRIQIGVMKALGYDNRIIMFHYTVYSLAVAVLGALLGTLTGLPYASFIYQVYSRLIFNLPITCGGLYGKAILHAYTISFVVSLVSGFVASRSVTAINPAESMRPEPPGITGRIILDYWTWLWRRLGATWKMSMRSIFRKWKRFGVTLMGVIFAVGLLVVALSFNDSIYYLKHIYSERRHYDYLVRFNSPVKDCELLNISRLDGVIKTEPVLEIPVKMHLNGRTESDFLNGLPLAQTLKDVTTETGRFLQIPEDGILINPRTAMQLGARVGDTVEVETLLGNFKRTGLKIVGIQGEMVGSGSYIAIEQANRILREKGVVSGAMLKVDPGKAGQVEKELGKMTEVSSISNPEKELHTLDMVLNVMTFIVVIWTIFALLLGFAVVYNSSVVNFAERKRELASLRVVGYTIREVSGLLLKENFLHSVLGVTIGLPFGRLLVEWYSRSIDANFFTLTAVVYPRSYLFAAAGGILFTMVTHLFAVQWIKRLNLVNTLESAD